MLCDWLKTSQNGRTGLDPIKGRSSMVCEWDTDKWSRRISELTHLAPRDLILPVEMQLMCDVCVGVNDISKHVVEWSDGVDRVDRRLRLGRQGMLMTLECWHEETTINLQRPKERRTQQSYSKSANARNIHTDLNCHVTETECRHVRYQCVFLFQII